MFTLTCLGAIFFLISPGVESYAVAPTARHLIVSMPIDNAELFVGDSAELFCDYHISSGEDLPVTVTWKVGGARTEASPILRCTGYTHTTRTCSSIHWLDSDFFNRAVFSDLSPSLRISPIENGDDRNYWCEVAVENPINPELEYDIRSFVIYLEDIGVNPPKLSHAVVGSNGLLESSGSTVTLKCSCGYGYCDDVLWYRGLDSAGEVEMIYSRMWKTNPNGPPGPVEMVYEGWEGRVVLTDNDLEISNIQAADTGRYWCEIRAGYYKTGLNPYAVDAKSIVLEVV